MDVKNILSAVERCCSNEDNRPGLQRPFRCNGYLYGCDGGVAIRVKDSPDYDSLLIPPPEGIKPPVSMDTVFGKGSGVVIFSEENVKWFNESIKEVYKKSNAEEYKVNPKNRPSCKCPICGARLYNRGKYSWELDLVDADEADEETQKLFAIVVHSITCDLALTHTRLNKLCESFATLGFPKSISFDDTRRFYFEGDGYEAVSMSASEKWYEDGEEIEVEKVAEIKVKLT